MKGSRLRDFDITIIWHYLIYESEIDAEEVFIVDGGKA